MDAGEAGNPEMPKGADKKAQRKDFSSQRTRKGATYQDRIVLHNNCTTPANCYRKKPRPISTLCQQRLNGEPRLHFHLFVMKHSSPLPGWYQKGPHGEPGLSLSLSANEDPFRGVSGGHTRSSNKSPSSPGVKEEPEFSLPPGSNKAVPHLSHQHSVRGVLLKQRF